MSAGVRGPDTREPRIGLFGLLGSGNIGNDGSVEAVLAFLRAQHPTARPAFMCAGAEEVTRRYGHPATRLHWNRGEYRTADTVPAMVTKVLGKIVDIFRTMRWVRGRDVVIVPGMGVLEATLPLRPWGFPYSLFLLSLSGRLFGTKIALVSVGADTEGRRSVQWLFTMAARLAHYRSYRDEFSREAIASAGVDVSRDQVYPDLAFALRAPAVVPANASVVGLGVMLYRGAHTDRATGDEIYASYVAKMTSFADWLIGRGCQIRLLTGDDQDASVADEIMHNLGTPAVIAERLTSLDDLMRQVGSTDLAVVTRYHNVVCALKMAVPTISIGYAAKNDVLMTEMGLGRYCQPIRDLDVAMLKAQFTELESRRHELEQALRRGTAGMSHRLDEQFAALTDLITQRSGEEHDELRDG